MNWRLKLCLLGILFGFMSCTNKIKKEMELLMSAPINFCDEQLAQYCHGNEINGNILGHHKYSLVVFVDSVTCSPCFWKQMPQWQSIVDSVNNHNVDISFAFVFHVKRKNRDRFIESMQQDTLFKYPVYLDTTGVFLKNNPNITQNKLLHTFLLDQNNRVILIGDPVQNRKIRDLFDNILLGNKL